MKKIIVQDIIKQYGAHERDCGGSLVQAAFLLAKIRLLSTHLKVHPHDIATKRALLKKVAQRQRLLKYHQRHTR